MYLKKIEVAGFKSFAEKTTIHFDQGLTAVVGPNGSGKSNITDAIRWVLGEQSAKNLRGGKMPDVIFSGTTKRKALNIAEVTLVLNNESQSLPIDFSEVSVTRRLNRNGESDYFINKQHCRLKDIVDLFTDSGLGKESFSIISQGNVEAIFNSKPEDRRGIFEEAAGVLKYKQRKTQAETKLFEAEDNLNRVQDIIYELESQLEPLKEQSHSAKEYQILKEQLTHLDAGLTAREIQLFKESWVVNKKNMSELDDQLEQIIEQKATFEKKLEDLKQTRNELMTELDKEQLHLVTVTQEYEKTEGQKNLVAERSKNTEKMSGSYHETLEQLEIKEYKLKQTLEEIKTNIEKLEEERTKVEVILEETREKLVLFSKSSQEQLEELRNEYVDIMQEHVNVKNDIKYLEKQHNMDSHRHQNVVDKQVRLKEKEQFLSEKKQEQETLLNQHQLKLADILKEYQLTQTKQEFAKEQLQQHEQKLFKAKGILQQAIARKNSLKDLQDNYSGFYQGVRAILKQKKQLTGIVGAVAELIQVPTELVLAIDTVLGGNAQSVVVKDEASGRACIQFLKQKKLGRATFLPLTTIKPRQINQQSLEKLRQQPGFVGIASELVSCPVEVQSVINNLLGLTAVATDLTAANQLAKIANYQFRVVSLEGDLMNPGGSMTGGATQGGKKGSLLTIGGEIEEVSTQIDNMKELLQASETRVRRLTLEVEELSDLLEKQRQAGESARLEEQTRLNQLANVVKEYQAVTEEQQLFIFETKDVIEFLDNYEQTHEELIIKKERLATKLNELDHLMATIANQSEDNEMKKEVCQTKMQEEIAKIAVIEQKIKHQKEQQFQKNQELSVCQKESDSIKNKLAILDSDELDADLQPESIERALQKLEHEKKQVTEALSNLKNSRETIQQELDGYEISLSKANKTDQHLLKEKTHCEVQIAKAENGMDASLVYLQEEYGISYEWAKQTYPFSGDLDVAKQQIKQMKQKIESLGPINLSAIEQYEQVAERHDFLVTQRDDLLSAKASLFQTMNEMDETVKERFEEIFIGIREKFQTTFPKMFGGGHADLVLTNPEDLLTTGIEIIAQPPGKKLQSLSLLSGGERALTAIALLFAIIQVRPVPFCVLDEVEAALDEANVVRFGQYLKRFEKELQFIVITHRKGTMEVADVLYGVTMQESGVSKIVSVKLEELTNDLVNEAN